MSTEQAIAADVLAALEADKLELPILPDMALKIRNMLDNPNVSTDHFVRALSAEPVISMHIIKTANNAALSNGHPVGNLHDAIFRLGYRMLHSLVMNITMTKLFKASSPLISEQWEHSREVAANSYVLAKQHRHLSPELAMLAGLVHGKTSVLPRDWVTTLRIARISCQTTQNSLLWLRACWPIRPPDNTESVRSSCYF